MSGLETKPENKIPVQTHTMAENSMAIIRKAAHPLVVRFADLKDRLPASPINVTQVMLTISNMSVRYKIAGTLITILAVAIASLGIVTFGRQKKILQQEMKRRAEVMVQQLANVGKEGLLTKQELAVFSTIKDIQNNSGVVYAMVADSEGKVFVHNLLPYKGKMLGEPTDLAALKSQDLLFQETEFAGEPVLEAALPIVSKARNIRIGTARIGLSEKELTQAIRKQKIIFLWISLAFVGVGLLISFALAKVLTKPLYTLAVGMQVVAQGDLSQQVKIFSKDEIGRLTEAFNQMILSLREKLHMEKYLSNSALKSIKRNRNTAMKLGGERKNVTALFSDVRGFTSMSEKMSPEEVVGLLNIYLNLQSKVVHQREGAVDKFVGDEVMAIFEGKDQEVNAVRAASEIQRYIQSLNQARTRAGKKQMQVGIGIHSGEVVMGNMGSEEQMSHTVIGDNINLAARLCSAAQQGQVVISKVVADALGKEAKLKKLDPIMVKGKDKPIDIYEVLEIAGASRRSMRKIADVPAVFNLAGLKDEVNQGVAKNVGAGGCVLEVDVPMGSGSKLELDLNIGALPP